ncbi:MAG: N-acetylgalactosamine 6-sulfate sulfatase, partial [Puniceicoccaceae bacterium]
MQKKAPIILSTLLAAVSCLSAAPRQDAPNLIVIMTDDQGYDDVSYSGGTEIPTPNIDRIAADGAYFTDAYVTYTVCGPSRAGFITGRYQQRFGFERNPAWRPQDPTVGLPVEERTLADVLGEVGYTSSIIGKWHLGSHDNFHPLNRGFDEFYGHLGGGLRYFPDELYIRDYREARNEPESYLTWIVRNREPVRTERYLTEEFTREALDFVRRQQDNPFFLFLSYNAPHAPMQAPEEEIAKFNHIKDERRRIYAAMVTVVDRGVGELLDLLDELNLSDNTIVFFLSDNGGPTPSNASSNSPLRGIKSS